MARKRTASDDEEENAYALSVAAAMAASEEEIVHTPSVRKKKKKASTPPLGANGYPKKVPVARAVPAKAAPARPRQPAAAAPVRHVVKKEKKLKYEPVARQEESEEVSPEEEEPEEELEYEQEEEEEDEDDEDEEEEEIAAPVVFQCGTCRSIFGDSYSFICSNAELLLVTLSAVTNISLSPEAHTSREGADRGSSFLELLCKQCQTVLGRQYLTTPPALDALRSLYSFATTSIASYQLGYPQLSQVENGTSDTLPSMDEIKRANQTCDEAVRVLSMDRDELLKLRDDMTKVQSLLVVVDERLQHLETQAEDSEQEDADDDTDERQQQPVPHSSGFSHHRAAGVPGHRNRPF